MQEIEYQRLIEDMCVQVGIDDSAEVVRTRHLAIDGTIVGLGATQEHEQDIPLLFDFGAMPDDGIERKLLEINAGPGMRVGDCFGMLPETGSVVYRSWARLDGRSTGADLAGDIQRSLERGRDLLQGRV